MDGRNDDSSNDVIGDGTGTKTDGASEDGTIAGDASGDSTTDDPYGLDLPPGWTRAVSDGEVTYENRSRTRRITIEEFSKHLALYWWVDVYERTSDGWERREVGVGDSYRDPQDAADAVQTYVDEELATPTVD
jgi:hypothetical protein